VKNSIIKSSMLLLKAILKNGNGRRYLIKCMILKISKLLRIKLKVEQAWMEIKRIFKIEVILKLE
jgi:hypothetical protein